MTDQDLEEYENKLNQIEKQVIKLEKSHKQESAKFHNLVRKIHHILDNNCGFSGEDYENEIPERRCSQIRKLIERY